MKSTSSHSNNLVLTDFSRYFFMSILVLFLGLFFWVISPFFYVLIYAALITVVFWPLRAFLTHFSRGYKTLVALFLTFFVTLIVVGPLAVFSVFLVQEALDALLLIQRNLQLFDLGSLDGSRLADWPVVGQFLATQLEDVGLSEFVNNAQLDMYSLVQQTGETLSSFIVNSSGSIFKSLGKTMLDFFIMLLSIFFLFRDGELVANYFKRVIPLPVAYENEIASKLRDTIYAIVFGNFGTALAQGVVGGIGLAIAGAENVLFWTTIMSFAGLLPYLGAGFIWGPFALSMILDGNNWGFFLIIWGFGAISSVDNLVRPFLIGGSTHMHTFPTFLVVLGGFLIFGPSGIVMGPLILSLAISILHLYQLEYAEILKEE